LAVKHAITFEPHGMPPSSLAQTMVWSRIPSPNCKGYHKLTDRATIGQWPTTWGWPTSQRVIIPVARDP
jgi:hypothetical protein